MCAHSSNWPAKGCRRIKTILHHRCVCSQQQLVMCMPTAVIGRPTLDPWVQPSIALILQHTCVCVLTAAIGLPKLLNIQNRQLTLSLTFAATHMCVLTAAMGRPSLNWPLLQYTCVCVLTAAIGLPKLLKVQNPQLISLSFYSCVCSQQQLVGQPSARVRNLLAGRRVQRVNTHVCADSSNWSADP